MQRALNYNDQSEDMMNAEDQMIVQWALNDYSDIKNDIFGGDQAQGVTNMSSA